MRRVRLSIVGFGTVGRWLAAAIDRRRSWLEAECGVDLAIVGIATRRDGFVYREGGFDIAALLDSVAARRPLADTPDAELWHTALQGLAATESDVLAEASNTNPREPDPALGHIRLALDRDMHVITSSKGACAVAAVDLAALARRHGVQFRMESTVMSGTPVLSTLREGLAGAHILTRMAEGLDYPAALADAQARGYAEPDPSDDVEGHDVVAKARILAAVAFGRTVALDQVVCRGIGGITSGAVQQAARDGSRLKLIASVRSLAEALEIRVEPVALPLAEPLSRVEGVMNALTIETDPVREITIIGPGAGPEQAGQGLFADLVAVLRAPRLLG